MKYFLVASLLMWSASIDDVRTQLSITDHCEWNYTEKGADGYELYRVLTRLLDSNGFKYYLTTSKREPGFHVDMLGQESDEKRRLLLLWETKTQANTVMVSYSDLLDNESILKRNYFHVWIKNIKARNKSYKIRFDCLEVARGVKINLKVCDVPSSGVRKRRRRRPLPACTSKTIDTISCSCKEARVNITGLTNGHHPNKPTATIGVEYSKLSLGSKMSIKVTQSGQVKNEYISEKITLGSLNGNVNIPDAIQSFGNYTIEIRLFCQDYSDNRAEQVCQFKTFNIEHKPVISQRLPNENDNGHTPSVLFIFCGVGIMALILSLCLYNRRKELMEMLRPVSRRRETYVPVSPDSPICPLNNSVQNTAPPKSCVVLSHYSSMTDFQSSLESTCVSRLKSIGFSIIYSWNDRHLAVRNWKELPDDITKNCTDIIIILSDSLIDLLELCTRENKTESETAYLKSLLCQRLNEKVPHLTLRKLISTKHSVEGEPVIHVVSTRKFRDGSDLQKLNRLYPQLFPYFKVYCMTEKADIVPRNDGIELSIQDILADIGLQMIN